MKKTTGNSVADYHEEVKICDKCNGEKEVEAEDGSLKECEECNGKGVLTRWW